MNGNGVRCVKRLEKEIEDFRKFSDSFTLEVDSKNSCLWKISFLGADGTIYAGEKFTLQFKFNSEYPIESPEVIFVGNIPEHEHIYSNGYICLSILYDEWSPALRVSSVCLSILSMLSSAKQKKKPPNDAYFSSTYKSGPKSVKWMFDDDKV